MLVVQGYHKANKKSLRGVLAKYANPKLAKLKKYLETSAGKKIQ